MQLGGTPPQLFDQAKDGVADIVWTLPTYQAGRFLKSEVFELPFMAKNAETGSPALWEYVQKNSLDEFKGVKVLALHVHDGVAAALHEQARDQHGRAQGAQGARADADRHQVPDRARRGARADAGAAGARSRSPSR